MAFDSALFIERSIEEVFYTLGQALLLVLAVTFVFLRSLRATLIPLVTQCRSSEPLSLSTPSGSRSMCSPRLRSSWPLDWSWTMPSSCWRTSTGASSRVWRRSVRRSKGAASAFAVIEMTLTLATVFAPLAYMSGNTGRLFREFALAVSAAVIVSGFVALTLTPMMCSKMLVARSAHGWIYMASERWLASLTRAYRELLAAALRQRSKRAVATVCDAEARAALSR